MPARAPRIMPPLSPPMAVSAPAMSAFSTRRATSVSSAATPKSSSAAASTFRRPRSRAYCCNIPASHRPLLSARRPASAVEGATIEGGRDFIRDIVAADLQSGRRKEVVTRFPPEPNGYLHIGHAKSICLNFGVAAEFGGRCHLRFDDTNPTKEEQEYIDAIERDVRWLGFDWGAHLHHASDYFEQLYEWAEHLIQSGHAFVDDTPPEEMRAMRGTLTRS